VFGEVGDSCKDEGNGNGGDDGKTARGIPERSARRRPVGAADPAGRRGISGAAPTGNILSIRRMHWQS
jgi:hypothetical protein